MLFFVVRLSLIVTIPAASYKKKFIYLVSKTNIKISHRLLRKKMLPDLVWGRKLLCEMTFRFSSRESLELLTKCLGTFLGGSDGLETPCEKSDSTCLNHWFLLEPKDPQLHGGFYVYIY